MSAILNLKYICVVWNQERERVQVLLQGTETKKKNYCLRFLCVFSAAAAVGKRK